MAEPGAELAGEHDGLHARRAAVQVIANPVPLRAGATANVARRRKQHPRWCSINIW
jgi:hypothetical protein